MDKLRKDINRDLKNFFNIKNKLYPALFLDRDGVIIKDCHYIKNHGQVELEENSFELIKYAKNKNWIIIVVTNQSGIGKGLLNWEDYKLVTKKMISLFGETNPFCAIYANSEKNNSGDNNWRKPSPNMIIEACNDFPIDIKNSFIIGDRLSDIQAGARAGLKNAFHVLNGHGIRERGLIKQYINNEGIFIESGFSIKINLIDNLKQFPKKLIFSKGKNL